MCGLGGVFSSHGFAHPERLARIFAEGLAHRGPDGGGFLAVPADGGTPRLCRHWADVDHSGQPCGLLVHRRLSIIDLATGDQPMSLADGSVWIVFNGEIYNHPKLRSELVGPRDPPFQTTSDTEVILRVYRRWGIDGFGRLNGMFAFALYDVARRVVILARDPLGVKPLYWTQNSERLAFASEIRPLLRAGLAERVVAPDRLAEFLFYRFVPAPGTLWRGVRKVVPGHALCFRQGGELVAEVDFAPPPRAPVSRNGDWSSTLGPQFVRAVQRQMLADVPVGAFLSGGLDSCMVVAAMTAKRAATPTFAVGFPDRPARPSELQSAAAAAAALGTRHSGVEIHIEDYLSEFPWAIAQVEEPLAHPGMLLQADLARLARAQVKVVLTGQGADEPLGGYSRHRAARLLGALAWAFGGLARGSRVRSLAVAGETASRIRRLLAARPGVERVAAMFSPLAPQEAGAAAKGCGADAGREAVLAAVGRWWQRSAGLDDTARMLYVDIRTSLAEDLLLVSDKMSMAWGLEARVPFLDLEYLAEVEAIPGPERVRMWGHRKHLQHAIAQQVLPLSLARALANSSRSTRRKRGFDVPVDEWFRGKIRGGLLSFLAGPESLLPEFVEPAFIQHHTATFLNSRGNAFRMVLALYVLEIWLRIFLRDLSVDAVGLPDR